MSLIYRAIWQDDRPGFFEAARDSYKSWVGSKLPSLKVEVNEDVEIQTDQEHARCLLRVVGNEELGAVEGVLTEDRGSERWTTRFRALAGGRHDQWFWVDVERVATDVFRTQPFAAPRLVRKLLDDGLATDGNPRVGPVALSTKAVAFQPQVVGTGVVDLIEHPDRTTPIVVFSHDQHLTPTQTMDRAQACADILAGVATVFALSPEAQGVFERLVGRDLSVWGGAARLYLPGELAPLRQRYIRPGALNRHKREAGQRFALMLSGSITARRAPKIYERVRPLLRERVGATDTELLEVAEIEVAERNEQIDSLRTELDAERDERLNAYGEVEELQQQVLQQRSRIRRLQLALSGEPSVDDNSWSVPDRAASLAEAVEQCRQHLELIELPDDACVDIELLDRTIEADSWAQTAWAGFRALNAYAVQAATFGGGFWEWCQNSDHVDSWPATPKKLAMRESETVMSNPRHRQCRVLPVSRQIDPNGSIAMEAHLKIAEGGGGNAPRIYFYDDTGGASGKIHIGFFGPHRYMPNTKTN